MNVGEVGHHAQHRHATQLFEHAGPVGKQAEVAPELVDDDAFDAGPLFRPLQHDAAVDAGKHAAPVDVAHQQHVCFGMHGHRHVHQIGVAQIDF